LVSADSGQRGRFSAKLWAVTEPTRNGPEGPKESGTAETELEGTQASEATEKEAKEAKEDEASEPTERVRRRHSTPSERSGSALRWLTAAALVAALAALGVGLWVLLRGPLTEESTASTTSNPAPPPGPSPQQVADAKAKACGAYNMVFTAVNGRANADMGSEPEAASANARLAASFGSSYLLERLDFATPPPLADAIRTYAANIDEAAMNSLAGMGVDDPAQARRINEWGPLNDQITGLCK